MASIIPIEQRHKIILWYLGGLSTRAVERLSGWSTSSVARVVRAAGYELRSRGGRNRFGSRFTVADVEQMARLYQAGQSLRLVGRAMGCSPVTVLTQLRAAGYPIRPKGAH